MLPTLLITFREGIESFLIISVITAYLRRIDRAALIPGVRIGVALSVVTSVAGAWLWLRVPNQPIYEGVAALVAAAFVGTMLWQAVRAGRRLKGAIEARIGRVAVEASPRALAGIAFVTAFLITREGLEAVFYVGVQVMAARAVQGARGLTLVASAVAGVALATLVAAIWVRAARRLNLAVVLKVTAVFLGLFLLQLVIYGVHELAESGVIEGSQHFHDLTEAFGPDGRFGHLLSYSLVAAPALYLAWVRRAARARPA